MYTDIGPKRKKNNKNNNRKGFAVDMILEVGFGVYDVGPRPIKSV